MPAETAVPVAEKGVDVVLNGGKKEMDSATIPVQFFLSPEVISLGRTIWADAMFARLKTA